MSDKSDLKAELERKKQRLAQIREEKKRKEEERKKKEVNTGYWGVVEKKENHLIMRGGQMNKEDALEESFYDF